MKKSLLPIPIILFITTAMVETRPTGTVTATGSFDAKNDGAKLLNAVKGVGTNEQVFISILPNRSCQQREEIRKANGEAWMNDIIDDFTREPTIVRTCIESSFVCGGSFYSYHFAKAFKYADVKAVAEMLSILSNQPDVFEATKQDFFTVKKKTFEEALGETFSGDYLNWCREAITRKRNVNGAVDAAAAENDAKALLDSMNNWENDRQKLDEYLLQSSVLQAREIMAKFKELNNNVDLMTAINEYKFEDDDLRTAYQFLSNM